MGFSEEVVYTAAPGWTLAHWTIGVGTPRFVERSGDAVRVVRDGEPGPTFDRQFSFAVSPDRRRAAYGLARGDQDFIVLDGEAGPGFLELSGSVGLVFGADSRRFVYGGCDATIPSGGFRVRLVVDQQVVPDVFLVPTKPAVGVRHALAYAAQSDPLDTSQPHRECVVHNDTAGPQLGALHSSFGVVLSADGGRVAYGAALPDEAGEVHGDRAVKVRAWHAFVDHEPGPAFDGVAFPIFSDDGKRFSYVADRDERRMVVTDGQVGPEFDLVGPPVFSPDGAHLAYMVATKKKRFLRTHYEDFRIWRDGELSESFDEPVGSPPFYAFSADGAHFALLAASDNKVRLVVDGRPVGQQFDAADSLQFGPAGVPMFTARLGGRQWRLVRGEDVGPPVDHLDPPVFSTDGRHIGYEARTGPAWNAFVDGERGPDIDDIWPAVATDNGFAWAARRGNTAVRVEYSFRYGT